MNLYSIQVKLLFPIFLIAIIVISVCTLFIFRVKDKHVETTGLTTASTISKQIETTRIFYANEVLTRTSKAGIKANYDFAKVDNTLPLPATFVKVLGEQISKNYPGTVIRLYSRYPFPYRINKEKYDSFELKALDFLEKDPKTPIYQLENYKGRLSIRYATADIMKLACIDCHNSHPESPKKNWKKGDVRGVLEIVVPVDSVEQELNSTTIQLTYIMIFGLISAIAFLYILVHFKFIKPIKTILNISQKISQGKLDTQLQISRSNDEIGQLTQSIKVMIDYLTKMAQTANSISIGNLNVQIQPYSHEDVFGIAFKKMILYLKEMASVSNKIVKGDLTTKVSMLSPKDVFGNAFKKMAEGLRLIIQKLKSSVDSLNTVAEQLVVASNEEAKNTTNQASSIQKISATLIKMKIVVEQAEQINSQAYSTLSQLHNDINITRVSNKGSVNIEDNQISYINFGSNKLNEAITVSFNSVEQMSTLTAQQTKDINQIIIDIDQIKETINSAVVRARRQQRSAKVLSQLANDINSIVKYYRF